MTYETFKSTVSAIYKERISSGINPEAASGFSFTDFADLDYDEFKMYVDMLDNGGILKMRQMRGFVIDDSMI